MTDPRTDRGWTDRQSLVAGVLTLLLVLTAAACGGDGAGDRDSGGSETGAAPDDDPTSTQAADEGGPLEILVTNDDGVGAEGLDLLVQALADLPDVRVTVVAPAENQSGSSDSTTPSSVPVEETTTASGYDAVAVVGFPADSVAYALGELGIEPDLVVSGVNAGQNIGPLVELSGTVGAARTAARDGFPALAVSAGLADPVDFASAVAFAVGWVEEHRDDLAPFAGEVVIVEVPVGTGATEATVVDCTSDLVDPVDDVQAFVNGYATLSEVGLGGG